MHFTGVLFSRNSLSLLRMDRLTSRQSLSTVNYIIPQATLPLRLKNLLHDLFLLTLLLLHKLLLLLLEHGLESCLG